MVELERESGIERGAAGFKLRTIGEVDAGGPVRHDLSAQTHEATELLRPADPAAHLVSDRPLAIVDETVSGNLDVRHLLSDH